MAQSAVNSVTYEHLQGTLCLFQFQPHLWRNWWRCYGTIAGVLGVSALVWDEETAKMVSNLSET